MKIDLYLNHDIGLWVLDSLCEVEVKNIITVSDIIAKKAQEFACPVYKTYKDVKSCASIGISIHHPEIFSESFIAQYTKLYNLHPGYLPYGRGMHPVFWAMWESTPAGATLHEIVPKLDAGPIVDQLEYHYRDDQTGYDVWMGVQECEKVLFQRNILKLTRGTYHNESEIYELKKESFYSSLSPVSYQKLKRCLSFPGYPNLEKSNA